ADLIRLEGGALVGLGSLAPEHPLQERLGDLVRGGADHQRCREQECVEGLDAERPGADPPDEPDRERDEDGHQPSLRSARARRAFVSALNAPFMARSAPDPSGGSIPIWRAKPRPSKYAVLLTSSPSSSSSRSRPRSSTCLPVGSIPM